MSEKDSRCILITGANGQVGGEIKRLLGSEHEVHALTRQELDLTSPRNVREVVRAKNPRWIINAAAYTAVDRAETDADLARAVNTTAPGILGEEAARIGAAVLHFSTDYVYPGSGTDPYTEDAPTGPLGVYGATKLAGEAALAASGAAHIILRTSWVYGATGKNFLLTILRLAREKQQLTIVDDQHGAPTWSYDLARLAQTILAAAPNAASAAAYQGIFHASSAGETTWFGFAQEAIRQRRLQEPLASFAELIPIPTTSYPTPAQRPFNSRLDCRKLKSAFGFEFPSWEVSLAHALNEVPLPHH